MIIILSQDIIYEVFLWVVNLNKIICNDIMIRKLVFCRQKNNKLNEVWDVRYMYESCTSIINWNIKNQELLWLIRSTNRHLSLLTNQIDVLCILQSSLIKQLDLFDETISLDSWTDGFSLYPIAAVSCKDKSCLDLFQIKISIFFDKDYDILEMS